MRNVREFTKIGKLYENKWNFNAGQKMQVLKGFPSKPVFSVRMLDPPWHLP